MGAPSALPMAIRSNGMSLERQLKLCERHLDKAYVDLLRMVKARKKEIIELAKEGVILGYDKYGDESWNKTYAELQQDSMEEIRDALVYQAIKRSRGWV